MGVGGGGLNSESERFSFLHEKKTYVFIPDLGPQVKGLNSSSCTYTDIDTQICEHEIASNLLVNDQSGGEDEHIPYQRGALRSVQQPAQSRAVRR